MIEELIISHLGEVSELPVKAEYPDTVPEGKMLIVNKESSSGEFVRVSTISVISCAESKEQSIELSEQATGWMKELPNLYDDVTGVTLENEESFHNITKKWYRQQAMFRVSHYV